MRVFVGWLVRCVDFNTQVSDSHHRMIPLQHTGSARAMDVTSLPDASCVSINAAFYKKTFTAQNSVNFFLLMWIKQNIFIIKPLHQK